MDLYSVLFYLKRIRENQECRARKELAQMKLLVLAIHGDPEKFLESVDDAEYKADYDEEVGDIAKMRRFGKEKTDGK